MGRRCTRRSFEGSDLARPAGRNAGPLQPDHARFLGMAEASSAAWTCPVSCNCGTLAHSRLASEPGICAVLLHPRALRALSDQGARSGRALVVFHSGAVRARPCRGAHWPATQLLHSGKIRTTRAAPCASWPSGAASRCCSSARPVPSCRPTSCRSCLPSPSIVGAFLARVSAKAMAIHAGAIVGTRRGGTRPRAAGHRSCRCRHPAGTAAGIRDDSAGRGDDLAAQQPDCGRPRLSQADSRGCSLSGGRNLRLRHAGDARARESEPIELRLAHRESGQAHGRSEHTLLLSALLRAYAAVLPAANPDPGRLPRRDGLRPDSGTAPRRCRQWHNSNFAGGPIPMRSP